MQLPINKKWFHLIGISVFIFLYALFLRLPAGVTHHPFWVDEFSSAVQAQSYLDRFFQVETNVALEKNNFLTHGLIASSFLLFGASEVVARIPFIFIGSMVPVAVFFFMLSLQKKGSVALISSLLVATSYIEITWSVQARGYVLQQLLGLGFFLAYLRFIRDRNFSYNKFLLLIILAILGVATHNIFVLVIVAAGIHAVLAYPKKVFNHLKQPIIIFSIAIALVGVYYSGIISGILSNDLFRLFNNVWYYHALFWKYYSFIILFCIIGVLSIIWHGNKKNKMDFLLPLIFMSLHAIFITFFFGHYIAKYALQVFLYVFIFAGIGLCHSANSISPTIMNRKISSELLAVLIVFFIAMNGSTFAAFPQKFYSVNRDMRDIAVVDYDSIYDRIALAQATSSGKVAIVDTWPDRSRWYLGNGADNFWYFRWENLGFRKNTPYTVDVHGNKFVRATGVPYVGTLMDITRLMSSYQSGFLYIDDSTLPQDIQDFARENMYLELEIDSYAPELLENPYSRWPARLYSWGINSENPYYKMSESVQRETQE